jgi:hypothetical protein
VRQEGPPNRFVPKLTTRHTSMRCGVLNVTRCGRWLRVLGPNGMFYLYNPPYRCSRAVREGHHGQGLHLGETILMRLRGVVCIADDNRSQLENIPKIPPKPYGSLNVGGSTSRMAMYLRINGYSVLSHTYTNDHIAYVLSPRAKEEWSATSLPQWGLGDDMMCGCTVCRVLVSEPFPSAPKSVYTSQRQTLYQNRHFDSMCMKVSMWH